MAKILIIEDDPYVRRFYGRLFNLNKYQVEMVENPQESLAKIKSFHPQLILVDIKMPKVDGYQVLTQIKNDPETKNYTVVMLTNLGEEEMVKKCMQAGALGFIYKSNTPPNQLLDEVDKYLTPTDGPPSI